MVDKKKMHKKPGAKPPKKKVTFVFDNDTVADHFLSWLCGSGEQEYWQWMECRESEESGEITVTDFNYWGDKKKKGKFGAGDILCTSGRVTEDFDEDAEEAAWTIENKKQVEAAMALAQKQINENENSKVIKTKVSGRTSKTLRSK